MYLPLSMPLNAQMSVSYITWANSRVGYGVADETHPPTHWRPPPYTTKGKIIEERIH